MAFLRPRQDSLFPGRRRSRSRNLQDRQLRLPRPRRRGRRRRHPGVLLHQHLGIRQLLHVTSESASFSTGESDDERIIVTGVRSDRLFFDRADTSSSLAAAAAAAAATPPENQENHEEEAPFAASVVMAMDSDDPYADFKKSMEEMVESQGMRDWESLQELLGWYLKMNGKANHGFIVGAFVDLLIQLTSSSSSSSSSSPKTFHDFPSNVVSTSYSSAFSTLSSPPTSLSSLDLKEIHEQG